eukprot:g44281.t1
MGEGWDELMEQAVQVLLTFLLLLTFWGEFIGDGITATASTRKAASLGCRARSGTLVDGGEADLKTLRPWSRLQPLQLDPQLPDPQTAISEDRMKGREHIPMYIHGTEVERMKSIKFFRVAITDNLSWTSHTDALVKKAQQRLFFLRQLRKFDMSI